MKLKQSTSPAIDTAFTTVQSPVFVVTRHGRSRRFLSRSAALNNLVHFMVTGAFDKAGITTHEDSTKALVNGHIAEKRGELTGNYWNAYHRTHRRVIALLNRRRKIDNWKRRHDSLAQQFTELLSNKPF